MAHAVDPPAEAWDRVAKDYRKLVTSFTSLHAFDLLSSVADQVRSAKTILDVACGTGALCMAYIRMFPQGIPGQTLIMTDISSEMVSLAEENLRTRLPTGFQTDLQFRAESATDMKSITDSSVDVLVSCFGIFLIRQRDAALNEVKRVLKAGAAFAMTAWTDLPTGIDLKTAGFGAEFQATIGEAFDKLRGLEPSEAKEPPIWRSWSDPDASRKTLSEASFSKIRIHRSIHTATFESVEVLWNAVTRTCPFVDVSGFDPNLLEDIRKALADGVGVKSEGEIVYVIMSSNIMVSEV